MYKKALTELAHVVNTIQTNQSSAAAPSAAASEPKAEIQTSLAAIINLSHPNPPVSSKSKTEMQQMLALLTAKAGTENTSGGGGGGGGSGGSSGSGGSGGCCNNNPNNPNNTRNNCCKVSTKPNIRYKHYYWSHGINPTHDSRNCNTKFPGHQDAQVCTNQMGEWETNAPRWCGFITP